MAIAPVAVTPPCSVLLAAGLSRRMPPNKCLTLLNGRAVILHTLEKLLPVSREVIIVLGHDAEAIQRAVENSELPLGNVRIVLNERFAAGTFSSLQTGIRHVEGVGWILYHFADQPFLPPAFYTEFISQVSPDTQWLQPMYKGGKGHPVLLNAASAKRLLEVPSGFTIRDAVFSCTIQKEFWDCDYPEILKDIDTAEDLPDAFPEQP